MGPQQLRARHGPATAAPLLDLGGVAARLPLPALCGGAVSSRAHARRRYAAWQRYWRRYPGNKTPGSTGMWYRRARGQRPRRKAAP